MRKKTKQLVNELVALKGRNGKIDPKRVVEFAKANTRAALHGEFQWDLKKAAWAHWIARAREIIFVHVRYIEMNGQGRASVPVFVSSAPVTKDVGYFMTEGSAPGVLINLCRRDVVALLKRYRGMMWEVGVRFPTDEEVIHYLGLDEKPPVQPRTSRRRSPQTTRGGHAYAQPA